MRPRAGKDGRVGTWKGVQGRFAANAAGGTRPGDVAGYLKHWISFQERFNDILPMIPIYGNYYVDFYRSDLVNYRVEENMTWSDAVVAAWLEEQ